MDRNQYIGFIKSGNEVPSLPGEVEITIVAQLYNVRFFIYRPSGAVVVVGSGLNHISLLYSGEIDNGHYDFIKTDPLSFNVKRCPSLFFNFPIVQPHMCPNLRDILTVTSSALYKVNNRITDVFSRVINHINDNWFACDVTEYCTCVEKNLYPHFRFEKCNLIGSNVSSEAIFVLPLAQSHNLCISLESTDGTTFVFGNGTKALSVKKTCHSSTTDIPSESAFVDPHASTVLTDQIENTRNSTNLYKMFHHIHV